MLKYSKLSFWEKDLFFNDLDITIIGAGIVGYSTAISLKEKYPNKKIVILERGYLPTGASTKNAGFTCFGSPTELLRDLENTDENAVLQLIKQRYDGLNMLITRCGDDNIDYLNEGSHELFTNSETDIANYNKAIEHLDYLNNLVKEATGIKNNFATSIKEFGFKNVHGLIHSKGEGQIHTGKMMDRLHRIAVGMGIHVLFSTTFKSHNKISEEDIQVETEYGEFKTKKLIFATNGLSKDILPDLDLKPARGQIVVTEALDKKPFEGTFHYDEGYFYFRNVGNRILVGGGRNRDLEGETTTEIENSEIILSGINSLLNDVIFPDQKIKIDYQWAGIMGVGENRTPIVKKIDSDIYAGVRLGGMGVALGSTVGKQLTEKIEFKRV